MSTLQHLPNDSNPELALREITRILKRALSGLGFSFFELAAYELTNEAVRRLLEGELQRLADGFEDEVAASGQRHRRYTDPATVSYHGLSGPLMVTRHLYRRVGDRNGPTIDPVALSAGIMEGATPALARSLAQGYADHDMRQHRETMLKDLRLPPSRATMERVAKQLASKMHTELPKFEQDVRGRETPPADTCGVVVGLDRTAVPMEELCPGKPPVARKKPYQRRRPPPIEVNYRMAYVGTVTCVDEDGKALQTLRYSIPAADDPATIAARMRLDVEAILASKPTAAVGLVQDGAPEMWNVMRRALQPLVNKQLIKGWEEGIDRYHLLERLSAATAIVLPDECERAAAFDPLIKSLDHDDTAIDKIYRRLLKHANDLKPNDEKVLVEHLTYIENNKDRMRYVGLRLAGLSVGSGVTESAAKVVIKHRTNRSGQRWSEQGLRGLLNLRALRLGDRFDTAWQRFARCYATRIGPVANAA